MNIKLKKKLLEYFIYIIVYAFTLLFVSSIFSKYIYIDYNNYGIWAIIAALIISILNITLKPFLVFITLPITALTLGLFYPLINLIILKIVDIILGNHFTINGFVPSLIFSIALSIIYSLINKAIINPILKRGK